MKKENQILFNKQLFKDYLDGNLSKEDRVIVERELNENSFYRDALDGYKQNPKAFTSLHKLANKQPQVFSNSLVFKWGVLLSLLTGISIAVYQLYPTKKEGLIVLNSVTDLPQPKLEESPNIKAPTPILELSDSAIEVSELKESNAQVDYHKVTEEQQNKKNLIAVEMDTVATIVTLEKVDGPELKAIEVKKNEEVSTESVPLISLNGLINVNYSKIKSGYTIEKNVFVLTGIPANRENGSSTIDEPSHELVVKKVAYSSYLEDIQFYFRKNKFKKALKGYKEILKQHPSDLNAHFYSALCYYNINQSEKALEHLKVVNEHQYDTFRQEGEWYSALALFDLKRNKEAYIVLQKIIKRNDFYHDQAIKLAEELSSQ